MNTEMSSTEQDIKIFKQQIKTIKREIHEKEKVLITSHELLEKNRSKLLLYKESALKSEGIIKKINIEKS